MVIGVILIVLSWLILSNSRNFIFFYFLSTELVNKFTINTNYNLWFLPISKEKSSKLLYGINTATISLIKKGIFKLVSQPFK